jgi:threonine dehydratase
LKALVALEDIVAAAERIRGIAVRTPLIEVRGPQGPTPDLQYQVRRGPLRSASFHLKCENQQPMGAFKIRGASNMLALLPAEQRAAGVVTYSSGNHGQAVALAAQRLGVRAVVVMPETAPRIKVDGVKRYGPEVIIEGTTGFQRQARAEAEAANRGLTIVPPFDHPWIIAGAGTCGLEIVEQSPELSAVFVPVGGGGLISGIAAAVKRTRPAVRVIGVEPAGAPKMSVSRAAGRPVTLERTSTIADGLRAVRPGDLTFAHAQAFVDDVITVSEEEIVAAVKWLHREAQLVAEPSGAVSVAGVLRSASVSPGTVAVVSGGNVEPEDFRRYVQ